MINASHLIIISLILFNISCSKATDNPIVQNPILTTPALPSTNSLSNVYVVGNYYNSGPFTAQSFVIWKEGFPSIVSTSEVYAKDIFISGSDIYAIGNTYTTSGNSTISGGIGKMWKNNIESTISYGSNLVSLSKIFVSGTDVYVSGYTFKTVTGGNATGILWKNNTTTLTYDDNVFITGTDVYSIANNGINQVSVLKNGKILFNIGVSSKPLYISSIFVSGTDVYVSGSQALSYTSNNIAKYWKNGIETSLSDGSLSTNTVNIVVNGTDIYLGGNEDNSVSPIIWKNGIKTYLTKPNGKNATIKSIYISGTDVYACGHYAQKIGVANAAVWKNNILYRLSDSTIFSFANAIYVKK